MKYLLLLFVSGCSQFTRVEHLHVGTRTETRLSEVRVIQGSRAKLMDDFELGLGAGTVQETYGKSRPLGMLDMNWTLGKMRIFGTATIDSDVNYSTYLSAEIRY